ncbi:MAG: PAS domain S-box protein [Terrimicrobiaceae bacterium]
MNTKPLRLLVVEDEAAHVEAIRRAFDAAAGKAEIRAVGTLREYREMIAAQPPDLALVDLNLPDGQAVEALTQPPEAAPFPILVMTAFGNEQIVVETMKAGALDYVVKSPEAFATMPQTVARALREWRLLQERQQASRFLFESEEKHRRLIEHIPDVVWRLDADRQALFLSANAVSVLGHTPEEIYAATRRLWFDRIHPDDAERVRNAFDSLFQAGTRYDAEYRLRQPDGTWRWLRDRATAVIQKQDIRYADGVSSDISERKQAEAEHDRLLAIIEATPDFVGFANPAGHVLHLNRAARKMLGFGPDEDITKFTIAESLPDPENNIVLTEGIPAAIRDGQWSGEIVLLSRDGRKMPMSQVILSHKSPEGKLEYLSTIMRDITERKRAEEELHTLRTAVEQSANTIVITDPSGNIEYANPTFAKTTGYTLAEAVGQNPRVLKSGEQDAGFYRNLWETITSGKTWRGEVHNRRKDGTLYWESATISPVQGDKGELLHFLAIKEDITERKAMEARLGEALIAAEAGNQAKSEFLGIMSHELRTPLNGVLGSSELLTYTPLDEEQKSLVETVGKCGGHLLAIVKDILDFSSMEAGRLAIDVAPMAVAKTVELSALAVQTSAAVKGLALRCDISRDVPPQIAGDALRIRQILINLLGNAVKFTSAGSVTLRVSRSGKGAWASRPCEEQVSAAMPVSKQAGRLEEERVGPTAPGGSFLDFSVEDTGIGISSETLGLLFKPFTQADSTMSRPFGGTGLGLAISKRLAEAMGGSITVVSTPGKGSTFTFHFPLESVFAEGIASVPAHLYVGADGASPSSPGAELSMPPEAALVLVVEDDPDNSTLAGKMLQSLGYRAEFAANGTEAVSAFVPGKFSAILMDVVMPGMNGVEATKMIREAESGSRVPIIALTANVMPGNRDQYLAAGMDDFLSKPFKRAELAAKLAGVAQR